MQRLVKVTRRGQTTIPREFRERYSIREGDRLLIEDTPTGILVRPVPRLSDLAGVDSEYGTVSKLKEELEKLREEYV